MNKMRWIRLLVLGGISVVLVACHGRTGQGPEGSGVYEPNGEGGSQTYGMGGEGQVGAENGGRHINDLKAPSNQVYYFDFDDITVAQSDYKAINIQANYLVSNSSAKIRLEGNTDSRGSHEYNIGLGWRRAQAVAAIFKGKGVLPSQIEIVSYGKERPAATGDDEQSWSLNRRVELVYENN